MYDTIAGSVLLAGGVVLAISAAVLEAPLLGLAGVFLFMLSLYKLL